MRSHFERTDMWNTLFVHHLAATRISSSHGSLTHFKPMTRARLHAKMGVLYRTVRKLGNYSWPSWVDKHRLSVSMSAVVELRLWDDCEFNVLSLHARSLWGFFSFLCWRVFTYQGFHSEDCLQTCFPHHVQRWCLWLQPVCAQNTGLVSSGRGLGAACSSRLQT